MKKIILMTISLGLCFQNIYGFRIFNKKQAPIKKTEFTKTKLIELDNSKKGRKFRTKSKHCARRGSSETDDIIQRQSFTTTYTSPEPVSSNKLNNFQILGLNDNASQSEIRRAYRRLYLRHNSGSNPEFKNIQKAYDSLTSK